MTKPVKGYPYVEVLRAGLATPAEQADVAQLLTTQAAEIKRLTDALQEVSRALGPYTRDPHEFAVGVIEDMQDIALNALVDNWADLKEQGNE